MRHSKKRLRRTISKKRLRRTISKKRLRHSVSKKRQRHSKNPRLYTAKHSKKGGGTKLKCGPLGREDNALSSCYTDEHLKKLQTMWNARHPDDQSYETSPSDIWAFLNNRYKNICDSERCWIDDMTATKGTRLPLQKGAFAPSRAFLPDAPASWSKNINEWLSSTDISRVMRDYELRYNTCFEFIGPSPIDYDAKTVKGSGFNTKYVYPELKNFSVSQTLARGRRKIGIVFNLDPHTEDGSHWVALYLDLKARRACYFDSTGNKIPNKLIAFINKLGSGKESFRMEQVTEIEHQKKNTECGIYAMYFLIGMLKGSVTMKSLKKERVPDALMEDFRKEFYNIKGPLTPTSDDHLHKIRKWKQNVQ